MTSKCIHNHRVGKVLTLNQIGGSVQEVPLGIVMSSHALHHAPLQIFNLLGHLGFIEDPLLFHLLILLLNNQLKTCQGL
jgi:hypothetical protein